MKRPRSFTRVDDCVSDGFAILIHQLPDDEAGFLDVLDFDHGAVGHRSIHRRLADEILSTMEGKDVTALALLECLDFDFRRIGAIPKPITVGVKDSIVLDVSAIRPRRFDHQAATRDKRHVGSDRIDRAIRVDFFCQPIVVRKNNRGKSLQHWAPFVVAFDFRSQHPTWILVDRPFPCFFVAFWIVKIAQQPSRWPNWYSESSVVVGPVGELQVR